MAVVAQRERVLEVRGQRRERREVPLPLRGVERAQADALRPGLIAEAEDVLRKARRGDDVEELGPKLGEARGRAV